MSETSTSAAAAPHGGLALNPALQELKEKLFLGLPFREYLETFKTPGDLAIAAILAIGIPVSIHRFSQGLGAATNLSQTTPWGLWVAFDIMAGVALAAGGFTLAFVVVILGARTYAPVLRPAILTGFLGYVLVLVGLLYDLGQPWRLPYQFFLTPGTTAVMYEVGWCVMLYLLVLAFEFLPAPLEWLGLKKVRMTVARATMGAIVLGVVLSTLHQSSLGAFFLMTPDKLHPLWYSPFLPLFFFVSAISAGIGMVIVESALSHRLFGDPLQFSRGNPPGYGPPPVPLRVGGLPEAPSAATSAAHEEASIEEITLGLAKGGAIVLFSYLFVRLQGLAESNTWALLATGWGAWWLFEIAGFVVLPCGLFARAVRTANVPMARWAAVLTVLGVVLNRLNVSLIALGWKVPERYVPSFEEIVISATVVTLGVLAFRFVVARMPVLKEDPAYPSLH